METARKTFEINNGVKVSWHRLLVSTAEANTAGNRPHRLTLPILQGGRESPI
jgi:hypothetical protein